MYAHEKYKIGGIVDMLKAMSTCNTLILCQADMKHIHYWSEIKKSHPTGQLFTIKINVLMKYYLITKS